MKTAYLGFGSNVGDRLENLQRAQEMLAQFGITFVRRSSVYETEPHCIVDEDRVQPWFLNQVVQVETDFSPMSLFLLGKEVEARLGRTSHQLVVKGQRRYAPRIIDIDLLLYEDVVLETKMLQVPHPRFYTRRYDLEPLWEIAPQAVHPAMNLTITELLQACEHVDTVRVLPSLLREELKTMNTHAA